MESNFAVIRRFYSAFQVGDYKTMKACYSRDASFSDPVFNDLKGEEVPAMWEMLITRSADLSISYSNVIADEVSGSANWIATYTFQGKKVINRISSSFTFENGKIKTHEDAFDLYKWNRQALGLTGVLLGWTPFVKNKVRHMALRNLTKFMSAKK